MSEFYLCVQFLHHMTTATLAKKTAFVPNLKSAVNSRCELTYVDLHIMELIEQFHELCFSH